MLPRLRFASPADPRHGFAAPVREVWVEIGAGSGEHALAQVAAHPEAGLIACEVFENGLAAMLSRAVPEAGEARLPERLRVWDADARLLLRALPDRSVERMFLLFPDPWPKARHAKRRFVHPAALPEIARVLREGAEWRIATDDATHQAWVAEVFAAQDFFEVAGPLPRPAEDWPPTRYEAKALAAGRTPRYWRLRRTGSPVPGDGEA